VLGSKTITWFFVPSREVDSVWDKEKRWVVLLL
jgi:hypothetical protein